jgi:hypothetical protein
MPTVLGAASDQVAEKGRLGDRKQSRAYWQARKRNQARLLPNPDAAPSDAFKIGMGQAVTQAERDAADRDQSQPNLFDLPEHHRDDG